MSDEDKTPLTKPAEMSFSDWKKMKHALSASTENKPEKGAKPKSINSKTTNKSNANNRQNNVNQNRITADYQSLQYFENLKLNNLRLFNQMGNMGFPGNQMLMMQALTGMRKNNMGSGPFNNNMGNFNSNIGPFNNNMANFNNNIGPFNNNMGNINNNMQPRINNNMGQFNNNNMNSFNMGPFNNNNMGPCNNNNMCSFNNNMSCNSNNLMRQSSQRQIPSLMQTDISGPPPGHLGRPNPQSQRRFTENFLGKNDEFFGVSNKPIPQQVRGRNKGKDLSSSNDVKTKTDNNKTNEKKQKPDIEQPTEKKPKTAKQKRPWNIRKPSMPPPIIAITPEAIEAKQRMWREYRQQMKQFKNRDYSNAKRTIQRLKKKNFEELDEKDKERWNKANDFVNAHKKMLSERAIAREAASSYAANVQDSIKSEYNKNPPKIQVPTTLLSHSNGHSNYTTEKDQPSSSGTVVSVSAAKQYGLWNSFVPGGVLFESTGK